MISLFPLDLLNPDILRVQRASFQSPSPVNLYGVIHRNDVPYNSPFLVEFLWSFPFFMEKTPEGFFVLNEKLHKNSTKNGEF
jgi:hypothetical protein